MVRVAQISVLAKVAGNVNADEVIGQRITLKKFYTSEGEVKPFISARAVKYAIRQALKTQGFEVDPFQLERGRLFDSGNPLKYIDNDIFGFMVARRREEVARRRQAPIALSYFRALRDTAIKAELGLRAPRLEGNPLPFEIEVAEWIGRLDCLIYDYIGVFEGKEGEIELENGETLTAKAGQAFIDDKERRRRLKAFLDVFLTPSYVLPRRTNSLSIPEYLAALVSLSEKGPWPIYQYLDYGRVGDEIVVDTGLLTKLISRGFDFHKLWLIDYRKTTSTSELPEGIEVVEAGALGDIINEIVEFLIK